MQNQEQNRLPEDFAPLSGTTTSPQSQPQNNPQYTYYYPQNLQASQNQGTTVIPQQQIYYPLQRNTEQQTPQAAHSPATPGTQPTYHKNQPGHGVVAQGNTELHVDWLTTREQNWIPHTSHRAALEQQEKERNERFGRAPREERRKGKDRRANKSRKLHIMTIIAASLALVILIAGFFAVFYQVSINNRLHDQENAADISYKAPVQQIAPPIDTKAPAQQVVPPIGTEASAPEITRDQEISRKPVPQVTPQRSGRSGTQRGIASSNKIIVTSDPSGALISTNGKTLGRTPFTWHNPAVYGMMVFTLEKYGYIRLRQKVEFTGGTLRSDFVLTEVQAGGREATPVLQEQIPQPAPQNRVIEPVVAPPPVPVSPAQAKPPIPRGPQGVIFISSLPPNADVYLNGRWLGITNTTDLTISAGTHQVTLVKDGKQLVTTLTVAAGKNPSQVLRFR